MNNERKSFGTSFKLSLSLSVSMRGQATKKKTGVVHNAPWTIMKTKKMNNIYDVRLLIRIKMWVKWIFCFFSSTGRMKNRTHKTVSLLMIVAFMNFNSIKYIFNNEKSFVLISRPNKKQNRNFVSSFNDLWRTIHQFLDKFRARTFATEKFLFYHIWLVKTSWMRSIWKKKKEKQKIAKNFIQDKKPYALKAKSHMHNWKIYFKSIWNQ